MPTFPTRTPLLVLALLVVFFAALPGCGNEVVVYDAIYLEISSEAPDGGPITRLDLGAIGLAADGSALFRVPEAAGDESYAFPLPANVDLVSKPYVVRLRLGAQAPARIQLRVRGLDDKLGALTTYSGVVGTPSDDRKITIKLVKVGGDCDTDGDGVKDCAKAGCCAPNEAGDCNDKAGGASPFDTEDPCTQCGNGIDEDCDGQDTACVDSDNDGVPDCQEESCGAGAKDDGAIYPGAPEVCDDKDNDCDGQTDEELPFVGIDGKPATVAKGGACGQGVCAGGTAVCAPDGKSLVCSSADKQQGAENCENQLDDDCNGKVNDSCALTDIDGDGVANDVEDQQCKHPYARFHSEIHPGNTVTEACCRPYTDYILEKDSSWTEKDAIPENAAVTDAILGSCDFNCDGKVKPCAPGDKDGDGVAAPLDCDDTDPMTYPGAAEKCGDGKVQGCVGADPACDATDGDGDGWSGAADCDDGDKTVHPGATELCNGKDDDCDGHVDDGNAEGEDASCGDPDGECGKQPGVRVCKHWPAGQDPGALDCLDKAFDATSLTCVGCEGDKRPDTDVCDYLDNDCDGTSDEDYTYAQQSGGTLKVGEVCDGIGACAAGKVECRITKDKAVCSTDPDGSKSGAKPEICDNKDNDCDGETDETLTSIADSSCHKAGVCSGSAVAQILTVCMAGKWVCDYTKVPSVEYDTGKSCQPGDAFCHCPGLGDGGKKCFPLVESSCEGKDNDCDGKTDDDFAYDDLGAERKIGDGCGTGACTGGKTICKTDGSGLTCDALDKISKETCDAKDNDCNGKTDDGMTVADSSCKLVGQCSVQNVTAKCEAGKWVCDYNAVPVYESSKEATCDGKDNDCDGKTDEDFLFDDLGTIRTIAQGCGTGACKEGNVVCTADKKAVTCSTLVKSGVDICDGVDNDCDGKTDEDYKWFGIGMGETCDGIGACGKGVVECVPGKTDAATCSTNPGGSKAESKKERCNDLDDDCDGETDEGCDDDSDDWCDAQMDTDGKPKACPKGGGDCNDSKLEINPAVVELCDGIDQNCDGKTDEAYSWTELDTSGGEPAKPVVGQPCGVGVCAGGTVTCTGLSAASCSTADKSVTEICDDLDNDCDGLTDEGCDDDDDDHCDSKMTVVGTPKTCSKGGGDCADFNKDVNPSAIELCDDIDNNCDLKHDELCDQDGDGWCDAKRTVVGKPKICPNGGGDCDDAKATGAAVNPAATEVCNDVDDDCKDGIDAGCDDDKDGYCDKAMTVVGTPKTCAKGKDDCNDAVADIHPGSTEICNDLDDDCSGQTDEKCDEDNDGYCDEAKAVVGKPKVCPKGGGDCDDGKDGAAINPGADELCNGKDDNCNSLVDAADAVNLQKKAPFCENSNGVCNATLKDESLCNKGKWDKCDNAYYAKKITNFQADNETSCDDADNDCDTDIDEGCDDDNDDYCDDQMTTVGKPKVCPKGGNDCYDKNDAKGPKINPGQDETCLTPEDDNCNGSATEPDAIACVDYYYDGDKDGWGNSSKPKFCLCKANSDLLYTATQVGDCNDNSNAAGTHTYTDPKGTKTVLGGSCGLGICGGGTVTCASQLATCSTASKSTTELCNGKDDDCDGTTDEDPDLSQESCTGKGVCKGASAAKSCSAGKLVCDFSGVSGYEATEKSCDNKDNDCDGETDESIDFGGFTCSTKGVCGSQNISPQCVTGTPTCDYSGITGYQATENKCDGKDNDCDGTTDESPDLSSLTCSTKGVCALAVATKSCSSGTPTCTYVGAVGYEAVEESCDNKDNDCDGTTDGLQDVTKSDCKQKGVCTPNKVKALCTAGAWSCDYSGVDGYEGTESTCDDGKDNDCNGTTDGCGG
ncbi:MAG: putative metal-binding motif-containing protein [Deltaproteobacteria bacterium]|nr:putative metal-binding motif-containing protein [Deltaproteobacteria bacterium]